jgi:predicted Zn-dependent protease
MRAAPATRTALDEQRAPAARSPQELALTALRLAADCDDCVAIAEDSSTVHVRWAADSLTTNGAARSRRFTVVCVRGPSAGVASHSGALDDSSLEDLVARAKQAARGDCAEPAESLITGSAAEDWALPPAESDAGVLARFAAKAGAAIERAGSPRSSLSGYAEQQVSTTYLASSSGLLLRHEQPRGLLDLVATRAGASAWRGVGTACVADLDVGSLRAQLDQQLGWTSRRAELWPGKYEVLLAPAAVADLMLQLYQAAGAGEAAGGQGPFSRSGGGALLGQRLSPAALTLRSDPAEPGLECAPVLLTRASTDRTSVLDNGLPLRPTSWITDGVLTALVQTRRTARLTGQHPSAEIANLVLEGGGDAALAELIARTERALLVTSVWYLRDVDPQRLLVTGLTRDGGYLVEHGEVVARLPDFRFNESPVELLGRVSEVGRSEPTLPREWGEHVTRVAMPALRVRDFDVSAVSR